MKSKKIRDSARGEECTMQVFGVCNHNTDTTVYAHLNYEGGAMGAKSPDYSGCYACSDCHDFLDGRNYYEHPEKKEIEWYKGRALQRTVKRLLEKGVYKV